MEQLGNINVIGVLPKHECCLCSSYILLFHTSKTNLEIKEPLPKSYFGLNSLMLFPALYSYLPPEKRPRETPIRVNESKTINFRFVSIFWGGLKKNTL